MNAIRIDCHQGSGDRPPTAAEPAADILLLPGRAAFLPATRTLLVADLHLGKAATFRRAGIPVPEGSAQRDLERLGQLVETHDVQRLVVLGDLFHARSGCTPQVFAEFAALRARIAATSVVLVLGNHDRAIGRLPDTLGLDACMAALDEPPFRFVHEPATDLAATDRGLFTVAGHLHPTVAIRSPSGDRLADRCFVAEPALLVLPAFGSFTGGHRIAPVADTRLWSARDDGVADVTRLATGTAKRPRTR
ncbi:MAG: ligase-associated DNA damage response endonuclease PdeM [Planctomycetia bacterium]